jgi:hypothetical protein
MRVAKSCCLLVLASLLLAAACHRQSATESGSAVEFYTPVDGAVGLDILPLQSAEGSHVWLVTYTNDAGTTKFRVELGPTSTGTAKRASMPFGQGRFLSEPGSDPLPLLRTLKETLKAKLLPTNAQKVDSLAFDYLLLGENQTRSANGSFSSNPKGNWTTLKLFFPQGGDEGEVYFNINETAHQAEFAIKDPDYGNYVLAELASIF